MSATQLMPRRASSTAGIFRFGLALVSIAIVALLIIGQSRAAFNATTDNGPNAFNAATISLSDDDGAVALFNVSAMLPGDVAVGCITVTYAGSADPGVVKIYPNAYVEADGAADGATMDDGLTLEIEIVDDCTALNVLTTVDTGTSLSAFAVAYNDYSDGLSAQWDPAGPESESYLVTATFTPSGSTATDNTRIGDSVTGLLFTWETQAGA